MKFLVSAAVAALAAAPARASQFVALGGRGAKAASIDRVVGLIEELRERIKLDGKAEQESYDKFACWCEDTLGRKAKDISSSKDQIEELGALIIKLKAEIASHAAEIVQSKKDLAANVEAQREASEIRDKDHAAYQADKTESEQCVGALEAAVKVLSGAGAKRGFLETMQEAQLLSVVAGVKTVFMRPSVTRAVAAQDLDMVKRFVERPEEFMGGRSAMSAAQLSNNPFGDYAPQSTQIQGILKGMYDTFVGDLEKSNADEAEAQKSFEELMATKQQELETLQATLESQELDEANKNKALADSESLLDDTKAKLDADEKLFEEVKAGCKSKAEEWSERTHLRTMELQGVAEAIRILTSEDSRDTFNRAVTTFVQVSSKRGATSTELVARSAELARLARKYHNSALAQIAVLMKSGGHFDKVMAAIDKMVEVLRVEEQDDIAHRDRCQNAEGKNANDIEDLGAAIGKAEKSIARSEATAGELSIEIDTLKGDIAKTESEVKELLELRNQDVADFRQAVKDDTDAIALLEQAMAALTRFYKKNDIELSLVSKQEPPQYTVDKDKAPETTWSNADYQGRKEETRGVVAIVEMIKEDLQKEIKEAQQDDADNQAQYEKERGALQETLDSQLALKLEREKQLNAVEGKIADTEEHRDAKSADLGAENALKSSLMGDCSWVKTHFESRREKRKAEMDGLVEAKSYLAGVEAGEEV